MRSVLKKLPRIIMIGLGGIAQAKKTKTDCYYAESVINLREVKK